MSNMMQELKYGQTGYHTTILLGLISITAEKESKLQLTLQPGTELTAAGVALIEPLSVSFMGRREVEDSPSEQAQ